MREIEFRGKQISTGKWFYGDYRRDVSVAPLPVDHFIHLTKYGRMGYLVDPATVGQYTGSNDKNGKKIFEGDICKTINTTRAIKFDEGSFCFGVTILYYVNRMEVIGNIHDNPELLEAKP